MLSLIPGPEKGEMGMGRKRRRQGAGFKAKVALEAIRMQATVQELAVRYSIHPQQVTQWKSQAVGGLEEILVPDVGWTGKKLRPSRPGCSKREGA